MNWTKTILCIIRIFNGKAPENLLIPVCIVVCAPCYIPTDGLKHTTILWIGGISLGYAFRVLGTTKVKDKFRNEL